LYLFTDSITVLAYT